MGCALTLFLATASPFVGSLATLWALRDDHEVAKVCGALTIIAGGILLALGYFLAFQAFSPRKHAERKALETYATFEAAVREDDFERAWALTCPDYRQSTTFERFEDSEADQLATTGAPTVELMSPETAVVYPGMWSGGSTSHHDPLRSQVVPVGALRLVLRLGAASTSNRDLLTCHHPSTSWAAEELGREISRSSASKVASWPFSFESVETCHDLGGRRTRRPSPTG